MGVSKTFEAIIEELTWIGTPVVRQPRDLGNLNYLRSFTPMLP